MGWKDIAKLGKDWAEAKKTELLTTDNHQRSNARYQQDEVERAAQQEAGTSLLEAVLPEPWAQKVTDMRPENVAARRAEADARADAERRVRLAGQATGRVQLRVTGGEHGELEAELPVSVEEQPGGEAYDDGPPPLDWLTVRVEAPDAVRFGTTTLTELSLAIPAYAGPGSYDLVDLMRRGEAGEIEWWEVLDIYLVRGAESDDSTWYPELAEGPAWVEVSESAVTFELAMQSALSAIRLTGTITWA
ncbi:hypothetical protein [Nocardioides sp. SYSU DS0651]|uniref:hypothetical protein n=1 Tax=Nocardioides sp. SYSU DS0651 TaxID=3415955 RepID=UPI003F4C67F7